MEDVARRAGTHRVTIYRRFESKSALVQAVFLRELDTFLVDFRGALSEAASGLAEAVAEGFAFTVLSARRNRLLNRLLETDAEVVLPYLTLDAGEGLSIAVNFLAGQLRASSEAPAWMETEAEVVAETQIRLVLSFLLTPASAIALTTAEELRAYGRRYLSPMVTGGF